MGKHKWVKSNKGFGWQRCSKCGAVRSLSGRFGGGVSEEHGCPGKKRKN